MGIPLHLQRGFSAGGDRKLQLFLEGIRAAGPLNLIARLGKGALSDPAYPGGGFIFVN